MYIAIEDKTIIRHIQKKFTAFYSFLQINFYHTPYKKFEGSSDSHLIYPGKSIGEVKQTHLSSLIEITPLSRVSKIEKEFQQRFGLPIQIFLKNKNKWQQNRALDDFTFKELNELGRNSSDDYIITETDLDYTNYD